MPSSATSVSPVSGKLGLAPVSYTLNTGDLVLRDQHQYLLHPEAGGFLMPLLCVGPSVQKCHRQLKLSELIT